MMDDVDEVSSSPSVYTYSVVSKLHYLPTIILVVAFCTFACTVTLFFALHHNSRSGVPYLSETGVYFPESAIFRTGVDIIAVLVVVMCVAVCVRSKHSVLVNEGSVLPFSESIMTNSEENKRIKTRVWWNLVLGITAACSLSLLGTVSLGNNPYVHSFAAQTFFLSVMLLCFVWHSLEGCLLQYEVNDSFVEYVRKRRKWRKNVTFISAIVASIYIIILPVIIWGFMSCPSASEVTGTCATLVSITAASQYITIALFLVLAMSFREFLNNFGFAFFVKDLIVKIPQEEEVRDEENECDGEEEKEIQEEELA